MKNKFNIDITAFLTVLLTVASIVNSNAQIANNYPHDSLIQNDPDVIFTEMFEGAADSLTLSGHWNTVSPNSANILPDPSVPVGSHGSQSLRLITIQDGTNPNQNTLVYKKLTPDITDSVFVRYYIKYDTNTIYHHSGLWVGGKNPPSSIPGNIGGILPLGNQEFHVGTEIKGVANGTPSTNSLFGLYTYWMGMHQSSFPPPNNYFGNEFYNNTTLDNIDLDSWNCIEVMVKLNNPVTSANGQIKLWINGNLILNLGYQFPTGTWSFNHFTEGAGLPFEGFQFRNNSALNLNYIWLRNFNNQNTTGHSGNIYFDHLVVAKKYIGPISTNVMPPLPITYLTQPTATIQNNQTHIRWSVATQINNDRYIIEHSTDGRLFSEIGNIKGDGTFGTSKAYEYVHETPGIGPNYYRVKQVDYNGQYSYSEVCSVLHKPNGEIAVYPNPANEIIRFSDNVKDIIVFNFYGQLVLQTGNTDKISTTALQDGLYMIKADDSFHEIIIKHR